MAAPDDVVNVEQKLLNVLDLWAPKTVAEFNGYHVKVAKIEGEFIWHSHAATDEMFFVVSGSLEIELENRKPVTLSAGELYVVPRGVPHRPVANTRCEVLLIEPAGVLNTENPDTAAPDEWV